MHIVLIQLYYHRPTPAYQEIASELRALGHLVWVGTPDEGGDLILHDGERAASVVPGPTRLPEAIKQTPLVGTVLKRVVSFSFLLRMRTQLASSRPDIVQVNPGRFYWLGMLPPFMPGSVRFVLDFRQVGQRGATHPAGRLKDFFWKHWRSFCSKYIYDRACFLHTAGARKILGPSWSRWGVVVPLGVGARFLEQIRGDPASNSNGGPIRFLYLGSLGRARQLERILGAAQKMLAETQRFRIVFVGLDGTQGYYHNLVRDLRLDSVVTFRSPVPYDEVPEAALEYDVALAYVPDRPADWLYQPTLKVLEYRALGMPILASDNVPNRDVVEHDVNGLLVPNSAEGLAQGMLRFVRDGDLLQRCKLNARRMRQGTTWREVARMYEQSVYVDLLDGDS
jgi:glycosyltransferase involved in cell wall biosynthesis